VINGEMMIYFIVIFIELFAVCLSAKAQTINQMFRDQYANPGSANTKNTAPVKKVETTNQNNETIKKFLANKYYYYGVFSCGKRVDVSDTDPGYSNNISGELVSGKTTITMSWGGNDPGSRTLTWSIDSNGIMSLKGTEKALSGRITTYTMNGNLDVKNNQIELNGTKTDINNTILRKCIIQVSLMETPEKLVNNSNTTDKVPNSQALTKEQLEEKAIKEQAAKELTREEEIKRQAAIEIEKKRIKEEAEAKAKEAEAARLAAIEVEKQKQREAAIAKAKADKEAEIERLAAIEIAKKRQKEEMEAKERAAKEAELARIAAIEIEKQKQKAEAEALAKAQNEAIAARVAAIEIEKKKQKDAEIERLAILEIEKKKLREEAEAKSKAEALRLAAIEAENLRQKEEAEAKAKAQRLIDLENEMKRLRGDTLSSKPTAQVKQEFAKNDNDPLSAFEGTWVSVNPPVFYLIFNKVALGIRQVSLPNIGQGNIKLSDGAHGSNFQISASNLNCYYFVTFTNNRQKMIMELKAGESLCLQSSILEKAE
jgi:hypothetical protein